MEWRQLMIIPEWTPMRDLDFPMRELQEKLHQFTETVYGMTMPYKRITSDRVQDGPFLTAVLWACSEGAARRVGLREIESDDGIIISPPSELLPYRDGPTYEAIEHGLRSLGCTGVAEHIGYRFLPDGAFVHRSIDSAEACYYFRSRREDDGELPYAIQWNLKGIPEGWGQRRPRQ
jgi:hypothetical protein